jgi:hypothetical protein
MKTPNDSERSILRQKLFFLKGVFPKILRPTLSQNKAIIRKSCNFGNFQVKLSLYRNFFMQLLKKIPINNVHKITKIA